MQHASLTQANRQIIEGLYAAGKRNDFEDICRRLHQAVVVHEPAFLPYGGSYEGLDAYVNRLVPELCKYLDVPSLQVSHLVADGDRVAAFITIREKQSNRELQIMEAFLLREGRIIEVRIYYYEAGTLISA